MTYTPHPDDVDAAAYALHPEAWDCDWGVSVFTEKDQAEAQERARETAGAVLRAVGPAITRRARAEGR